MRNKYILIGPVPGLITGQSSAFQTFLENTSLDCVVIDDNTQGYSYFQKAYKFFIIIVKVVYNLVRWDVSGLYLSCTRTRLGSIKDILILNIASFFCVTKICVHLHGMDMTVFRNGLGLLHRMIFDFSYFKSTDVIVLHDKMISQFDFLPDVIKRSVVPNFYSRNIDQIKPPNSANSGGLKVLYLSNMMESKGVRYLVDAVIKCNSHGANVKLRCAGEFITDSIMEANILKKKLSSKWNNNIIYTGPAYGKDKVELLEWANILVLPSFYPTEAFPLCVLEGMAAGCYIIVSNHNILPYLIKEDFGSVVESQSSESIFKELMDLSENLARIRVVCKNNYIKSRSDFTVSRYIERLDRVIYKS